MNFFATFPECSLPSTVSKETVKMTGHHGRLRDVMGQSYPIYDACTRANHARYSSVQVTFCGSWTQSSLEYYLGKHLTGRKCRARGTIYKICRKMTPFKTMLDVKCSYSRCLRGHYLHPEVRVLCTFSPISFFPSDKIILLFLNQRG